MKRQSLTLITLLTLSFGSIANADFISLTCSNGNPGAITFNYGAGHTWNYGDTTNYEQVSMTATQSAPASMYGSIVTDGTTDPSLRFLTYIDNGSGLDWTNYQVLVFLSQAFTITNPAVEIPGDWNIAYTTNSYYNAGLGAYEGYIDLSAGTTVSGNPDDPGTLEYSYTILFSGATGYTFSQDLTPNPVPEPGTAGLLAMGLLLGGYVARRVRR
jgi:hypothetical protein